MAVGNTNPILTYDSEEFLERPLIRTSRTPKQKLELVAQITFGLISCGSVISIGVLNNRSIVVLVSSAVLGSSLQILWDVTKQGDSHDFFNHLKAQLSYPIFEAIWQVFYNLAQSDSFNSSTTVASIVSNTTLVPLSVMISSCWWREGVELVQGVRNELAHPEFTLIPHHTRDEKGLALLGPKTTNKNMQYLIEGLMLLSVSAGLVLTYRNEDKYGFFENPLWVLQGMPLGYLFKEKFNEILDIHKEEFNNRRPGLEAGLSGMSKRFKFIHVSSRILDLLMLKIAAFSLATGTASGSLIGGYFLGQTLYTEQRDFEVKKLIFREEEVETSPLHQTAVKVGFVIVYFTLATIFWSYDAATSKSDDRDALEAKENLVTSILTLVTMYAAFLSYQWVGKKFKEGVNNRLMNTLYFIQRHFPVPIVFSGFLIEDIKKNVNDSNFGKSNTAFAMDLIAVILTATGLAWALGKVVNARNFRSSKLYGVSDAIFALFMVKFPQMFFGRP